ncbi:MAG: alpha/beta hydrolase [Gammaproteobacteria bacterium]|nr:alpha/beta hydrolase [Gammaproteobacteria bacterium]
MKILLGIGSIVLFAYIGASVLLYIFQRDLLYFPTEKYEHPFDRFSISSQGETIELIVLNKGNSKALLYFGGNGEAVVANAEAFLSIFSDLTIYLVNYRGYGGSSGKPTESGICADSLTIYDEIIEHHTQLSVAGRSLGSGVATYLAAERTIESIVLITPYDSILNVVKTRLPVFPVKLLLKDHYDSLSRVKNIQSKVLVIAAEHDQVIPMKHTQRLIDEFGSGQTRLKIIRNSGHNSLSINDDYLLSLKEFVQ